MHASIRRLIIGASLAASGLALGGPPAPDNPAFEPLEIIPTVKMSYPQKLSRMRVDNGAVNVMVWVDDTGRLLDSLLVGHTHALLAKEVLEVLPKWKFRPARMQGQPVNTRTELQFSFKNSGMLRVVSSEVGELMRPMGSTAGRKLPRNVYDLAELDEPLDAVVEIAPQPPDRLGAVAREGSVVVEYLIDREGNVRMPVIISSDDEAFTTSVMLAITKWRYAVPLRVGQPAIARVRQKFTFSPAS